MEGVDNTSVFSEEIKIVSNFVSIVSKCERIDNIIKNENFHSFQKLLRITSWCLRFTSNLKNRVLKKGVNEHN